MTTPAIFAPGPMEETFGERLRRAAKKRGLSNADMAKAVGVDSNTVSKWMNDKQQPRGEALDALARTLAVSTGWLLRGDERPRSSGDIPAGDARKAKLPPRAYARAYEYIERLNRAGVPEEMVEEAERLMTDMAYSTLNKVDVRERSEDELIVDIDAAWTWIAEVIERKWGIKP